MSYYDDELDLEIKTQGPEFITKYLALRGMLSDVSEDFDDFFNYLSDYKRQRDQAHKELKSLRYDVNKSLMEIYQEKVYLEQQERIKSLQAELSAEHDRRMVYAEEIFILKRLLKANGISEHFPSKEKI